MQHPGQARHARAFTLIELLVVIAIIAILAAILFPVFAQARSKARQAAGTSNAKQTSLAILMYTQDYDECFPRAGWDCQKAGDDPTLPAGWYNHCGASAYQNVIAPYHKNAGIFTSPGDASRPDFDWGGWHDMKWPDGNISLLVNDLLAHTMVTTSAGYADKFNQDHRGIGLSQAAVNAPADCVLLAEGHCGWDKNVNNVPGAGDRLWNGVTDHNSKWYKEHTISGCQTFLLAGTNYSPWGAGIIGTPFYNTFGIVAFTDGHVKAVKYTDSNGNPVLCSTLKWSKHLDPSQRNADRDGCGDPNNRPGAGSVANWE